jgi:3-oxoacyl-[acyl-carrier-protein] synthase-3
VSAACTGFLYGLDIAASYFARKPQQKILLVGADAMSRMVDWQDRSTCVLFGDGAGAAVLGPGEDLLNIQLTAQGDIAPLYVPNGWGNSPFHQAEEQPQAPYLVMDGQEVFRFAVTSMVQTVERVLADAGLTKDDVDYLIPHQANIRIIDAAVHRLKLPQERCLTNIALRGNTSAACVAILLDESNRAGRLQKGDILVLTAFGGGLTTGACVLRWNK